VADGLLLTRRERLKLFWGRLGGGMGPPLLLAVVVAGLGGGAVAVAIAVLGVLLGLVVATNAKSNRGALVAGVAVAVALFVLQLVIAWLASHPIEKS
jgi:uncharacterized membrane protein YdbT with pleckstrin-like domain